MALERFHTKCQGDLCQEDAKEPAENAGQVGYQKRISNSARDNQEPDRKNKIAGQVGDQKSIFGNARDDKEPDKSK